MTITIGQKFSRDLLEKSANGGTGGFIMGFKKGDTTVRFLEVIDEWTPYFEHFDNTANKYFPCLGLENYCPGCHSEDERTKRRSRRFLANALSQEGYVNLYKLPVTVVDGVDKRAARRDNGDVTLRDYTVIRSGDGKDTTYDVDALDKGPRPFDGVLHDHQAMLIDAFVSAFGKTPEQWVEEHQEKAYRPAPAVPERVAVRKEDEIPPTKALADFDVDEGEMREMSLVELIQLFMRYNVPVPKGIDKTDDLVDYFITVVDV